MNFQVLVTWADRGGAVLASGGVPLPAARLSNPVAVRIANTPPATDTATVRM